MRHENVMLKASSLHFKKKAVICQSKYLLEMFCFTFYVFRMQKCLQKCQIKIYNSSILLLEIMFHVKYSMFNLNISCENSFSKSVTAN